MSRIRYITQGTLDSRTHLDMPNGIVGVYRLDLDDLLDVNATDCDRYQHAERLLMHYAADEERLRPTAKAKLGEEAQTIDVVWAGDLRDRDCDWHAWPLRPQGGQHTNKTSTGVLVLHRPTGVAVVETDERSQLGNKNAALKKLRRLLTKDPTP